MKAEAATAARACARALTTWPRHTLVVLVKAYRLLLKPWLGNACRFEPTCSAYAIGALERHGAVAGSALSGWRLLRCHPWCQGGLDPVPEHLRNPARGLFTRLAEPQQQSGVRAEQPPAERTPLPLSRLSDPS